MRLRILKDSGPYRQGQTVRLPKLEAELLIKQGIATHTKDMTTQDMKT